MSDLYTRVYEIVKQIPCGKVATYGDIATALGNKRLSRQVGWALHANPMPIIIPCHRVVFKDGSLAKNFAFGGSDTQKQLLQKEGIEFDDKGRVKSCFFVDKII